MERLWQDIRYGLRLLIKSPGFAAAAVISLALGIGVNTAIFSVVNAILLRPLPVKNPEGLVEIYTSTATGSRWGTTSYPDYLDFRDRNEVFSDLIAYDLTPMNLSSSGFTNRVFGELVSANYFAALGVDAARGRTFLPEEDKTPGANPVAVVSHRFWRSHFGSDADLIGKPINLNGHSFTVVGITPSYFNGTFVGFSTDVWVPLSMHDQIKPGSDEVTRRGSGSLFLKARLKPGITLQQAQAQMAGVAAALEADYPDTNRGHSVTLAAASSVRINPEVTNVLLIVSLLLMAVVSLVLLIACANVANLLLARAGGRRREIAIRLALGATRRRLIQQMLTESVILSLIGGVVGLFLALWACRLLVAFRPPISIPIDLDLSIDPRVLTFTLVASLLTGIMFGLAPAFQASRPDLIPALKGESAILGKGYRKYGLRNLLVVVQIAMSLFLLISAGLFIRSLESVQTVDPGFDTRHTAIMSVDLGLNGYSQGRGRAFYQQLIERIRTMPGLRAASWAKTAPLDLASQSMNVRIEGYEPPPDEKNLEINYNVVGLKYLQTLSIPLLQGRDFAESDTEGAAKVAIVNETMANRFWPGQDPLGKHVLTEEGNHDTLEVVGVAKDSKYLTLGEGHISYMYLPMLQHYQAVMTLHVSAVGDPNSLTNELRREFQMLDENLPVYDVKTLDQHLAIALLPARVGATLLGTFGLLAAVLSAVGIYGVMAYSVSRRNRELAIRMAVGARPIAILRLVLSEAAVLAIIGLVLGLALAFAGGHVLSSFLYGVSPTDPLTFIGISLLLGTIVLGSSYIPARKAMKADPKLALSQE